MGLEFNWKCKDYELRAVPKRLARTNRVEENITIELVKWTKGEYDENFCFTLAYWEWTKLGGYELRFVGDRMFEYIDVKDIEEIWRYMRVAQKQLDDYELYLTFQEYEDYR